MPTPNEDVLVHQPILRARSSYLSCPPDALTTGGWRFYSDDQLPTYSGAEVQNIRESREGPAEESTAVELKSDAGAISPRDAEERTPQQSPSPSLGGPSLKEQHVIEQDSLVWSDLSHKTNMEATTDSLEEIPRVSTAV